MDYEQKPGGGFWILAGGAILTAIILIVILVVLAKTFASGMSNQAINRRSDLGLTQKPVYHDAEGLATTKHVPDPWRQANPYTMMMR